MGALITIIIPVYNVEKFLAECVDSVICQTYEHLEIILVDDGSTDNSGYMCDEYGRKDKRIKVIHQKNQGLSAARNTGLEVMEGDYVYFLDSDDCIDKNVIEVLYNNLIINYCDIAIGKLHNFQTDIKSVIVNQYNNVNVNVYNTEMCLRNMLLNNSIGHEACGKLFSTQLWSNHRFPVGKIYEDYATIYFVVANAKRIAVCSEAIYFYRMRIGSIMNSEIKENNFMLLDISDDVTSRLIAMNYNIEKAAIRLNVVTYLKFLYRILSVGYNAYPDVQQRIINHVMNCREVFLQSKEIRKVDKIKLITLMFNKYIFYKLYGFGDFINKYRKR